MCAGLPRHEVAYLGPKTVGMILFCLLLFFLYPANIGLDLRNLDFQANCPNE
jgi:hypothetical protein